MSNLTLDVRYAWRRLIATPTYLVFSVATLVVGLTAVPTVHAVIAYFVWQTPVVADPDRVLDMRAGHKGTPAMSRMSWGDWQDLHAQQQSFEYVAASMQHVAALGGHGGVRRELGEAVTGEFFETMQVRMLAGRPLMNADYASGAPPVIVLSERLARRMAGTAERAVGERITLGGHTFTVVGVTPASFAGSGSPLAPPGYWAPMEHLRRAAPPLPGALFDPARRHAGFLAVRGRLKAGVSADVARQEVVRIGESLEASHPSRPLWDGQAEGLSARVWTAGPPNQRESDVFGRLGIALMTGVVLVLLLACTNLANLGFSRSAARLPELGVRRALGASRWRLIREQLIESGIVVGLGAVIAIPLTRWLLMKLQMEIPISRAMQVWMEPVVTPAVLIVSAVAALLAVLVSGLWPALRSSQAAQLPSTGLTSSTPARWRFQKGLIAAQVAGSVVLLLLTASMVDALTSGTRNPGVDLTRLGVSVVDYELTPRDDAQQRAFEHQVLAHLRALPEIDDAAASVSLPFGFGSQSLTVHADASGVATRAEGVTAYSIPATDGFWTTLGIPMLHGRPLTADDSREGRAVVVISRAVALSVFGTEAAVGRRVWLDEGTPNPAFDDGAEVVGVSADTDVFTMGNRGNGLVVHPLDRDARRTLVFTARAETSDIAVAALRRVMRDADPEMAITVSGTGWGVLAGPYCFLNALGWLASVLGLLTLVLVMSGLYGVLSAMVRYRRQELGVRLALGCTRARLLRLVMKQGTTSAAIGLVAGVAVGLVARAVVGSILPMGLTVVDPFALTTVPAVIIVATLVATWWPARRATRLDPNEALRQP